jgi:Tfp pilus assembly protein PilF
VLVVVLVFGGGAKLVAASADKVKEASERAAKDYLNHGLILAGEGHYENAAKSFRKALAIMPQWAEAHSLLGSALAQSGNFREAEEELRKAVALKPDYAEGWYSLGNFLKDRGKEAEAQEAFKKAKQYQR